MMVCNEAIDIINDILLSKEDLKQRIVFETREFEKIKSAQLQIKIWRRIIIIQ